MLFLYDFTAAHNADGCGACHKAEHVKVDGFGFLFAFDLDDVFGSEHVAVGVHDQSELGLSRINFQVFEHLERGAGRHMVDDDAVLNAGDFHQAATSLDSSGSYPGSSSPTTELSNAMRMSMPFLTCSK